MRETQEAPVPVAIHAEPQIKKTIKHIGGFRKIGNLKIWSYNTHTGELKEVVIKQTQLEGIPLNEAAAKQGPGIIRHQVAHEKGCMYVQALNEVNARRKFGLIRVEI